MLRPAIRYFLILCCTLLPTVFALHPSPVQAEELRIVTTSYPPFSYIADDTQTGLFPEIVHSLLNQLQVNTPLEFMPWSRAYKTAVDRPNTMIFPLAKSPCRQNLFYWIGPVVTGRSYLFALKNRTDIQLNSLEDARQYTIGTLRNDISTITLRDKGFTKIAENRASTANARKLILGWIDLWAAEESTAVYLFKELGYSPEDTLQAAYPLMQQNSGYLGFSRNSDPELVDSFQKAFEHLQNTEEYSEILSRYQFSR